VAVTIASLTATVAALIFAPSGEGIHLSPPNGLAGLGFPAGPALDGVGPSPASYEVTVTVTSALGLAPASSSSCHSRWIGPGTA
jgi:hypothetical protein